MLKQGGTRKRFFRREKKFLPIKKNFEIADGLGISSIKIQKGFYLIMGSLCDILGTKIQM